MDSNQIKNKLIVRKIDQGNKQNISRISLDLVNLTELRLNDNKLTEIKENAFISLNNLQELSLSNNQLTEIKENTFIGLNNLRVVYLYDNQLIEIRKNPKVNHWIFSSNPVKYPAYWTFLQVLHLCQ